MNKYSVIPSDEVINDVIEKLKENGFNPILVDTKEQALEKIKELLPKGSEFLA